MPRQLTYQERIDALCATKLRHTREKQDILGAMDRDDWGQILPPPDRREIVETMGTSGVPIVDVLLKGYAPTSNHPSGAFFGARAAGENFRRLLEMHPPYVDPMSSLLGGYCLNFNSYRKLHWNPDFDYAHLKPEQEKYRLAHGIGGSQHFCQEMSLGLQAGWGGLLAKIRHYCGQRGPDHADFYAGLEQCVLGMQAWMRTNVDEARRMAATATDPYLRQNLLDMAEMNERLIDAPPHTFREACQWITWYEMAARMYNGSGSLGRIDLMLQPYYERDAAAGILGDEEAIFHIACYLILNTDYMQLGGPDEHGNDVTSRVSYLVLEAAHRLKIPANIGVCVGKNVDPGLLRRGVEIMFEDKAGTPKFLGIDNIVDGFARNGIPLEIARLRAYAGCHWFAIPGREYAMNDIPKVNFAAIFVVAWDEMVADKSEPPSVAGLWRRFAAHLRRAIQVMAEGLDIHMAHMHQVFPELMLDLLCYDTIDKGLDASNGGVEFVNLCIDGAALATVADSFAALEQRVEREKWLTWDEIVRHIEGNWAGPDGERARLALNTQRYGSGGSLGDAYAVRITTLFTDIVKAKPTPAGYNLIPGLFSWALMKSYGQGLKATPNGRRADDPISHGANPDPGFRKDAAPTAMAVAIASVQPLWGNSAPMQIELDPGITKDEGGVDIVANLIKTHMDLGGTQINMNIMDAARVLEAHKDPTKYPDLVVRVTGFSAYFASLSPELRQMIVDRIIAE